EIFGKVFFDDANKPVKLLGTIRDITQQKIAKQQLEESEGRLRIAALSGQLGTWHFYPLTQESKWDTVIRKLFGVDDDTEITLDLFLEKIHPDDKDLTIQKMLSVLDPVKGDDMMLNIEL
ncbi:MAG: hypothetical protein ABI091_10825, partial [Ferruginibacter sp.]